MRSSASLPSLGAGGMRPTLVVLTPRGRHATIYQTLPAASLRTDATSLQLPPLAPKLRPSQSRIALAGTPQHAHARIAPGVKASARGRRSHPHIFQPGELQATYRAQRSEYSKRAAIERRLRAEALAADAQAECDAATAKAAAAAKDAASPLAQGVPLPAGAVVVVQNVRAYDVPDADLTLGLSAGSHTSLAGSQAHAAILHRRVASAQQLQAGSGPTIAWPDAVSPRALLVILTLRRPDNISDPYVRLSLLAADGTTELARAETDVIFNCANPDWSTAPPLRLPLGAAQPRAEALALRMMLLDKDFHKSDDPLAAATLTGVLSDLIPADGGADCERRALELVLRGEPGWPDVRATLEYMVAWSVDV